MDFKSITEKIENSKPLDFSSIFSRSIELFKEVWLQGFITLLLIAVIMIPFYILAYFPIIITAIVSPESFESDSPPILLILTMIVFVPIVILGIMMVSIAMSSAFLRICMLKDLKKMEYKDEYFYYFKRRYHIKLLKLSLLSIGLVLLGFLACGIGVFYIIVPVSLIPAFFAFDEELSAMEIVKASIALANKNWGIIFGLIFVMGLVAQLGVILCVVGVLFTASLAKIPVYFIHKDAISSSKNSTEDRLNALISNDFD